MLHARDAISTLSPAARDH